MSETIYWLLTGFIKICQGIGYILQITTGSSEGNPRDNHVYKSTLR